jgi:hypothetical protein
MTKKITILGSCRQQALYRLSAHATVTSVQEKVSYPHSTREMLEVIRFCKQGGISPEDTMRTFRTPILDKTPLVWTEALREEWEGSDIVVVEMASRLAFRYEGRYVHHILHDDKQYWLQPDEERQKIQVEVLDDAAIEEDLLEIRASLSAAQQLVVVTHLINGQRGGRYDLVLSVERICDRHNILCIQPAAEMEKRGFHLEDLVVPEEKRITHFTDRGHSVMATIFREILFEIPKKKTVVLAWTRRVCNLTTTPTEHFWGLGDLIRGAMGLFDETRQRGLGFYIDMQLHPSLETHLVKRYQPFSSEVREHEDRILFILSSEMGPFLDHLECQVSVIMTNYHSGKEASTEARAMMRRVLTPSDEMEIYLRSVRERLPTPYRVLHYRLGDDELVLKHQEATDLETHLDSLKRVVSSGSGSWLLLSDSTSFKERVRSHNIPGVVVLDTVVQHSGYPSSDDLHDTMLEFFLASRAQALYTYSVYPWVSGFMRSVSDLYGVPLVNMNHPEELSLPTMIIVTGASEAYVSSLRCLMDSFVTHCSTERRVLHVYDMGWSEDQRASLLQEYGYNHRIVFKTFDFSLYPDWMNIRHDAGQYAWKPVLLYETVMSHPGLQVVWMDARNLILDSLQTLESFTAKHGVYSPTSAGTIQYWTHPATLRFMGCPSQDISQKNRNAACLAIDPRIEAARSLLLDFYHYGLTRECIAPKGSSRKNHRQDQAVFTVLFYRHLTHYDHNQGDKTLGIYFHYQQRHSVKY